VSHKNSE